MDASRLRSLPLFSSLSRREVRKIAQWADEVEVPAGEALTEEGEFAHEFFIIEEGTAQVSIDDQVVTEMGPGDFFGEIGLMESERRTASVVAITPMRLVVMFQKEFGTMASEEPEVADKLRAAVAERLAVNRGKHTAD